MTCHPIIKGVIAPNGTILGMSGCPGLGKKNRPTDRAREARNQFIPSARQRHSRHSDRGRGARRLSPPCPAFRQLGTAALGLLRNGQDLAALGTGANRLKNPPLIVSRLKLRQDRSDHRSRRSSRVFVKPCQRLNPLSISDDDESLLAGYHRRTKLKTILGFRDRTQRKHCSHLRTQFLYGIWPTWLSELPTVRLKVRRAAPRLSRAGTDRQRSPFRRTNCRSRELVQRRVIRNAIGSRNSTEAIASSSFEGEACGVRRSLRDTHPAREFGKGILARRETGSGPILWTIRGRPTGRSLLDDLPEPEHGVVASGHDRSPVGRNGQGFDAARLTVEDTSGLDPLA